MTAAADTAIERLTEAVKAHAAVAAAWIHTDHNAYAFTHSLVQLLLTDEGDRRRIRRGGVIAIRCPSGQLPTARNRVARIFLDEGRADWLLCLDTDMGFAPDTLERLLDAADPTSRPVVGALCFAQVEVATDGMGGYAAASRPTIYTWTHDGDARHGFVTAADYPPDALVRCDGTGLACVLIHRRVLEAVEERFGAVWFDRIRAADGLWMGEDLSFFLRVSETALPVHVHTGIKTTHLKPVWLSEGDYLAQTARGAMA